jgi:Na+-driven multidrug efflux pump
VRGAGLATSLSIVVGIALLAVYMHCHERYLKIQLPLLRPRLEQWRRVVAVGLPASGEFILTFLSMTAAYFAIRSFGASLQAGFGIGTRILQVAVLPAMAIGSAVAPIAAQNFGANHAERVRRTWFEAALVSTAVMLVIAILVRWHAQALASIFATDRATLAAAVVFLELMSWTLVAQGLIYVCSSMFQALGNTVPALISSSVRFVTFAAAVLWLSANDARDVERVWHLLMGTMLLQMLASVCLLRVELRRRLPRRTWPALVSGDSR